MFPSVHVQLVTPEIHSLNAEKSPEPHHREQTLVYHPLVVQTHSAERSMVKASAHVSQATLEVHQAVALNAL